MEISHTSMSIAKGCWKKYYWSYIQRLSPIRKPSSLVLGTIVHKCFELHYRGASENDIHKAMLEAFKEEKAKADINDQEDLEVAQATAYGMWMHYPYKNLGEFMEVEPEKEGEVDMFGAKLRFRLDGLVKFEGQKWIREYKTTSLSLPKQFCGRIEQGTQPSIYVWGIRKMGIPVQGVMFEIIKKPLLRKRRSDTCSDYCLRIVDEYARDASLPKNQRKMYLRSFVYRSQKQMEQFETDVKSFLNELKRRLDTDDFGRNTDNCWNFNSQCPFYKICFMDHPDDITLRLNYVKKA